MRAFPRNHLVLVALCVAGIALCAGNARCDPWRLFGETPAAAEPVAWNLFCPVAPVESDSTDQWDLFAERTPKEQYLSEAASPSILLFSAEWCRPHCETARDVHAPWLRASGWVVEEIDIDDETSVAAAFAVDNVPTWVIVRDHAESGRHVGADREGLLAELRRAIQKE